MKMIELSRETFENYAKKSDYKNYCQTSNFGIVMSDSGFEYEFIGYTTNENEILAAGMFLIKKINNKYAYAYCPKGYLLDYNDTDLLKKFTHNIIKYLKKKKIIFLKINPEIKIATINKETHERIINENVKILENLKTLGFKKRKEIEPLGLIESKLVGLINLKEFDISKIDNSLIDILKSYDNNGLLIETSDASKIEYIYEAFKNKEKPLTFYRNFLRIFSKNNSADLVLVKIDYEKFLITSKKKLEEEQIKNDDLNEELQINNSEEVLLKKMKSDTLLSEYKQEVIKSTEGLKKNEDIYIAGAIIVKYENEINVLISDYFEEYDNFKPLYYLYYKIIMMYKDNYDILDLNEIADDFTEESKYYKMNNQKIAFNPSITEYIGELDLIISKWKFKKLESEKLLEIEFNKKRKQETT